MKKMRSISRPNLAIRHIKMRTLVWLLLAATLPAGLRAEEHDIELREVQQLVAETSFAVKLIVFKSTYDGCKSNAMNAYDAEVLRTVPGRPQEFNFCSQAKLELGAPYVVFVNRNDGSKEAVVAEDAVFLERIPGAYYRILPVSMVETFEGRELLMVGEKVEGFNSIVRFRVDDEALTR